MEESEKISYGVKFLDGNRWFYSSNETIESSRSPEGLRGQKVLRNSLEAFMHAISLREAGYETRILSTEFNSPTTPRITREYSIEEFGRVVIMGQIIRPVICKDNAEGIKNAKEGNLGVSYFGGQTYVFLSKSMYEETLGRENFENAAIEIFGKDELLKFAGARAELIKPGYFPEDQVCKIKLPSLLAYSDNPETKDKIDPKEKITGLVRLINKSITSKK